MPNAMSVFHFKTIFSKLFQGWEGLKAGVRHAFGPFRYIGLSLLAVGSLLLLSLVRHQIFPPSPRLEFKTFQRAVRHQNWDQAIFIGLTLLSRSPLPPDSEQAILYKQTLQALLAHVSPSQPESNRALLSKALELLTRAYHKNLLSPADVEVTGQSLLSNLERLPNPLPLLLQMKELSRAFPSLQLQMARLYLQTPIQDWPHAQEILKSLLHQNVPSLQGEERAQALFLYAQGLSHIKAYLEALQKIEEALRQSPSPSLRFSLYLLQASLNRWLHRKEAYPSLQKAQAFIQSVSDRKEFLYEQAQLAFSTADFSTLGKVLEIWESLPPSPSASSLHPVSWTLMQTVWLIHQKDFPSALSTLIHLSPLTSAGSGQGNPASAASLDTELDQNTQSLTDTLSSLLANIQDLSSLDTLKSFLEWLVQKQPRVFAYPLALAQLWEKESILADDPTRQKAYALEAASHYAALASHISLDQDLLDLYRSAADNYRRAGQALQAADYYQKILALGSKDMLGKEQILYDLALSWFEAEKWTSTRRVLQTLLSEYPHAYPYTFDGRQLLFQLDAQEGKMEAAEALARTVLNDPLLTPETRAWKQTFLRLLDLYLSRLDPNHSSWSDFLEKTMDLIREYHDRFPEETDLLQDRVRTLFEHLSRLNIPYSDCSLLMDVAHAQPFSWSLVLSSSFSNSEEGDLFIHLADCFYRARQFSTARSLYLLLSEKMRSVADRAWFFFRLYRLSQREQNTSLEQLYKRRLNEIRKAVKPAANWSAAQKQRWEQMEQTLALTKQEKSK